MGKYFQLVFITVSVLLFSCKDEDVDFSLNECKRNPGFIQAMGFNPAKSYISTSEDRIMGMVLIESEQPGNTQARKVKMTQHPSWRKGGWLAPILLDETGNIFTAPAPFITVYNNPVSNNNTIYKVDRATGEMSEFLRLPGADSLNPENPFGIIGMAYLCETGTLYVSTVAGSRRYEERGTIYAIDVKAGKVIDKIGNTDALGLGVSYITGKRELFFGMARNSDIMSVHLNSKGKFARSPQKAFSLAGIGARGDDKVRKIRTDKNGNLIIYGMEFNFNLIAPREKKETIYNFIYILYEEKWVLNRN